MLLLAQITEGSDDYDLATIVLFVVFILSLVVSAGLVLREVIYPQSDDHPATGSLPPDLPTRGLDRMTPPAAEQLNRERSRAQDRPFHATIESGEAPSWLSLALSSQRSGAVEGVTTTVQKLLDAANRGDLRAGFACYTPEYLAEYQREHGLDAAALERMARLDAVPAEHPLAIASITDVTIDPPHRLVATVAYSTDSGASPLPERYTFFYDRGAESWLVDGIEQA